jgi:hypothetical protein
VIDVTVDAYVLQRFPAGACLASEDPPAQTSAARIVRYGKAVRARFEPGSAAASRKSSPRPLAADVGPRTLAQVLERTRGHAAHHLRQVYEFLRWCEIEPDAPFTDADLAGIDLPAALR